VHILGVDVEIERVNVEGREVRLGVFPMGIDAASFTALADHPDVCAETRQIRGDGDVQLLVGVDRLDYTKGIARRLLAFEKMLQDHPELRERVRLIQVAVPSRIGVEAYQDFRALVDGLVGRINGAFGTARWSPVHYIYRGLTDTELVGLYRAADVMVVTPIRDGMNLVAKEFLAARTDGDGILVVSEFAGAAWELPEALQVNPNDVDGTAEVLYRALTMEATERHARLAPLRARVEAFDVRRWARSFIDCLTSLPRHSPNGPALASPDTIRTAVEQQLEHAPTLLLLLDYDGTLVPYTPTPGLARPDRPVLALLAALAARPHTEVHIVSGRSRDTLDQWLGSLPIALHAEHGFWSRHPGTSWVPAAEVDLSWREPVLAILHDFAVRTPGALVEMKSVVVAWHYRMVDPEVGTRRTNELRLHLKQLLSNQPVEILAGNKVIEIRPYGINKSKIIPVLSPTQAASTTILAAGDDRTDEDLFAALPSRAISVRVGPGITRAHYRLENVSALRTLLESLIKSPVPA
jgi:trehalose 6-phosphate synthase/phosphatase